MMIKKITYTIFGHAVYRYQYGLLALAQDFHNSLLGYTDNLSPKNRMFLYHFLCERLNNWIDSKGKPSYIYDERVKSLLIAVKSEYLKIGHGGDSVHLYEYSMTPEPPER